ncbi:hypothetical protein M406DRAFT_94515 [Cryphonectria parasitica EP155]|uniref:F-box domain-containing protein n=1 Tax=Cryphonectria parasitica (strain ATCC 38755 / EP155) TaxID=660469 RepID=A0A9P5CM05_CRYP1|nr:uncharacterized protein M406DRAFT_94515 [Cryphonectria parasitica EP155]KAF3763623.1 hypothetical protein M406DRAFT_94515 [Cryphonectria parasitica EP155]
MVTSLDNVPDEIVRQILQYVPPGEAYYQVPLVSKRLRRLAFEPLLWRDYCQSCFRYWHAEHCLGEKLQSRASKTDWRGLWRLRQERNDLSARLLDKAIATKVGRMGNIGKICQLGYDAKDFLLEQVQTPDTADDVLARRYFANTALSSIHRGAAVHEWYSYQRTPLTPFGLDRALAAFDMFFAPEDDGDIDGTCALLDRLAAEFIEEQDGFDALSTRDKALALLKWTRDRNLTGMDNPGENYRCLRNCLIGHALRDENHPSLPLVSCAIYTCLAERAGLRAACCAFPSHVHAMIMAPLGHDLDGKQIEPPTTDVDKMFLDPYGSSEEVHLADLRSRLVEFDWLHGEEAFLVPAPVPVLVQRVGRNMKMTFHDFIHRRQEHLSVEHLAVLRADRPPSKRTVESSVYAAHWANLLMTPVSNFQWDSSLDHFLHFVTHYFPEDAWMVEMYLTPLYKIHTNTVQPRHRFTLENVPEVLRLIRNADNRTPTVNRRYTQEINQTVWYTVGQVFRHKRYAYIGIINGWGERGTSSLPGAPSLAMEDLMDELSDSGTDSDTIGLRLRKKVFYTCLTHKNDRSVVAQDAIQIIHDPRLIPETLMEDAGKFFKKFDAKTCTFVSNVKEFYPDG